MDRNGFPTWKSIYDFRNMGKLSACESASCKRRCTTPLRIDLDQQFWWNPLWIWRFWWKNHWHKWIWYKMGIARCHLWLAEVLDFHVWLRSNAHLRFPENSNLRHLKSKCSLFVRLEESSSNAVGRLSHSWWHRHRPFPSGTPLGHPTSPAASGAAASIRSVQPPSGPPPPGTTLGSLINAKCHRIGLPP